MRASVRVANRCRWMYSTLRVELKLSAAALVWGDLDTHGFAILDRLRRALPHTESFLMDRPTLTAHRGQWVKESKPTRKHLPSLTGEEADLYQSLVDDDFGHGVRLEQERVRFSAVQTALAGLHGSSSQPPHDEGWPGPPRMG